jgi:predicted ATPase
MIKALHFKNFRILRDTTLPLGRVTVLLGPNGSGKSTVLHALDAVRRPREHPAERIRSIGFENRASVPPVEVRVQWDDGGVSTSRWGVNAFEEITAQGGSAVAVYAARLAAVRTFALDADKVALPVPLDNNIEPERSGFGIARSLTNLQDKHPERFDALNADLRQWLPEYDRVLLETPATGQRSFMLRTAHGRHVMPAADLSQGTRLAVALLTIAHLPEPPPVVGLEEPDRGIHPRLLRDVQEAIYRLAYPENYGDSRAPVQVILTTHSPYMVDLFRDHPEEIVLVKKDGLSATFEPLAAQPNIDEILRDAHLGDAWYSGVLGGVPAGT